MGACCTANENKAAQRRKETRAKNPAGNVVEADFSVNRNKDDLNEFKPKANQNIEKLIVDGEVGQLEEMIRSGLLNLNDSIFDSSKTALHVALQNKHRKVVELFLRYNADVNKEEQQTGNTPLFFAAADLNEEYVRLLLDNISKPNINHRNHNSMDIFQFLNNYFYKVKQRELPEKDKVRLMAITTMLKEFKERHGNVEQLDLDRDNSDRILR
jgi:ankyrin repeat protein